MSTVSTSDATSQYSRQISDLEADYQKAKKRTEEKAEAAEARLEAEYKKQTRRHEESAESAVDTVRKHAADQVERSNENQKAETERVKNYYYDRFGRSNGMEADKLKEQLDTAMRGIERAEEQRKSQLAASDDDHARKLSEASTTNKREMEENTKTFRDSVLASYEKSVANKKDESDRMQAELTRKVASLDNERLQEKKFNDSRADEAVKRSDFGRTRDLARADENSARKATEIYQAAASETAETIAKDRDSHTRETQQLRDQINALSISDQTFQKDKANGTEQAIRQYENDWRGRERSTIAAYEDQIGGLNRKAKESDDYFNHLTNRISRDKDAYFAGLIQKTNQDNAAERQSIQGNFDRNMAQMKAGMEKEREQSRISSEGQLQRSNAIAIDALEKQAVVGQETLRNQKTQDSDRIARLEHSLHEAKNSPDISVISPQAEENVRNYVSAEYDKKFKAERGRNEGSEDYIRRTLNQRVQEVASEKDDYATRALRDREALHQGEKALLMGGIKDANFSKETAIRDKDAESTRSHEMLMRNYTQSLEKQKRDYENIIDAMKADNSARMTTQRQEHDFERQMAQRSFAAQQNELLRESEKKLSDQKLEYETRFDEMKSQTQKTVQEAERRVKTAVEEQGRNYEQRIAQLEASYKERERYTAQNYEDQLEKVKRSNALLIQKKS